MTNTFKALIAVVITVIIGAFVYFYGDMPTEDGVVEDGSIIGCYVDANGQDVYTLNILSVDEDNFRGTLSFNNFEIDSSSGVYEGTYKDGVLLGDYSFQSEGMYSITPTIFKRVENGFVRGSGEMDSSGTQFVDLNNIDYSNSRVWIKGECAEAKIPPGSEPVAGADTIQGITWVWDKTIMNDGTIVAPAKAGAFTLALGPNGQANGQTDCNSYFASYNIGTEGVIDFHTLGSTKMFCEGSQEEIFTKQISDVDHYIIDGFGNLVLLLPLDSGSVLFIKK